MVHIAIQTEDFEPGFVIRNTLGHNTCGALASFIGVVRPSRVKKLTNSSDSLPIQYKNLINLELEHYPEMCMQLLKKIATSAQKQWHLEDCVIIHRVGKLAVGEQIVMAAASAPHRHDAFDACHYMMDWLKTDAPFWKQEHFDDGSSSWVQSRIEDLDAHKRWL